MMRALIGEHNNVPSRTFEDAEKRVAKGNLAIEANELKDVFADRR